jgi:stearoyl-CoA desaturase (delta-9 desaturase)
VTASITYRPHRIRTAAAAGFALVHVAALGVFLVGFSWKGFLLCLGSYYLRMFAVTAGLHRYFSHRTFKLGRIRQFLLAFLAQTSAQKGVLWWASWHRHHHRVADQPEDVHSPVQYGLFRSHIGWILAEENDATDLSRVPDLARYPELRWLDRNQFLATMLYAVALFEAFSWTGLFWGYFLSTVLLWHGTFTINSLMHIWGRRVFPTADRSRNSFILALLTMGEGWHNNHHFFPGSAAQGFRWWQVDATYYLLWLGERLRFVAGLRRVPSHLKSAAGTLAAARARVGDAVSAAFTNASDRLGERLTTLNTRWEEARLRVCLSASEALQDLEAMRIRTLEKLEELQSDYAAARSRAGEATDKGIEELRSEIDKAREQLAEVLERLLASIETSPEPA